jgi:hypothetical protein
MTSDEWYEVVEWLIDRYPNLDWPQSTTRAYFNDLTRFDVGTVWTAVRELYEAGTPASVMGERLVARAIDVARYAPKSDRPALPEGPPMSGKEFREQHGWVSWKDALEQVSKEH